MKLLLFFILIYFAYRFFQKHYNQIRFHLKKQTTAFDNQLSLTVEDSVTVLTLLFKIRMTELGASYSTIREYQEKAEQKGVNWLILFMQDYCSLAINPYEEVSDKKKEKLKRNAEKIYKENYEFCSIAPTSLYENELIDVKVALFNWDSGGTSIIDQLLGLKTFGIMQSQMDALIIGYQNLYLEKFEDIFYKSSFKEKSFRDYYLQVGLVWKLIFTSLKSHLSFLKESNGTLNTKQKKLFQLIEATEKLESKLCDAITRANTTESKKGLYSFDYESMVMDELTSIYSQPETA